MIHHSFAITGTPNAWSRFEFVPDVKPGLYRGIQCGTSFIEVRLSANGRGTMKIFGSLRIVVSHSTIHSRGPAKGPTNGIRNDPDHQF